MKVNSNAQKALYILTLSGLTLSSMPLQAQINKCISATGSYTYTNGVCTSGTKLAAVSTITWAKCANEFALCSFAGTSRQVRFGANGVYFTKTLSNSVNCDAGHFGGDPVANVAKTCAISSVFTTVPVVTTTTTTSTITTTTPTSTTTTPTATTTPTTTTTTTSSSTLSINDGSGLMPYVNLALAPSKVVGKDYIDLIPHQAGNVPILHTGVEVNNGEFRVSCGFSHMLNDDPIVKPNQPGASHLHTFFGNNGTNASSTTSSLMTSGNSTCDGGIMNRSAYWVPTVIDTRTGRPVAPTGGNFYYKTENKLTVVQVPKGLRMIAGSMAASATQPFIHWWCANPSDTNVSGDQGYIPSCAVGNHLIAVINFPAYWDGINLDSGDHKSHVSYTKDATHPVELPDITYNIRYDILTGNDTNVWRLSSDMYSNSVRGGYSLHADYMFGWNNDPVSSQNFAQIFTADCLKAGMNCGNSLLGDGRQYYY